MASHCSLIKPDYAKSENVFNLSRLKIDNQHAAILELELDCKKTLSLLLSNKQKSDRRTMANIKDVARLAGVSVSTVSRVINGSAGVTPDKTKAVLTALEQTQYQPNTLARALVSKRSNCIGLMVGELGSPFFAQLMAEADAVISEKGRHLMMTSGHNDAAREAEALSLLQQRQCDGLIVHAKGLSDGALQSLAQGNKPVVFINRRVPGYEDRSVCLDNEQGAYLATRHLLARGHRAISFIGSNLKQVSDTHEREAGYRRALQEYDLPFEPRRTALGYPDENGGSQAMATLLNQAKDCTAVLAYNDLMAAGAMGLLMDSGFRVPEDFSVVGFDDVDLCRFLRPQLTTVHYPIAEMSRRAAQWLLDKLDNHPQATAELLQFMPRLISRQSVTSPR